MITQFINHLKYDTKTMIKIRMMKAITPLNTNLFFLILSIIDFIFLSLLLKECLIYTTFFLLFISFYVCPVNQFPTFQLIYKFSCITLTDYLSFSLTSVFRSYVLINSELATLFPISYFFPIYNYQLFYFSKVVLFKISNFFLYSLSLAVLPALKEAGWPIN